jgi:hypothetical protein
MRAIAQPYLFHYYATGNLARLVVSDTTGRAVRLMQHELEESENDHLPSFLGAIIQRPDLAAHVKALQLLPSCRLDDFTKIDMDVINGLANHTNHLSRTSPAFRMLSQASKEIGVVTYNMFHPDFWSQSGKPHRDPRIYRHTAEQIHHALEEFAILSCPGLRTLVLGIPSTSVRFWPIIEYSRRTLPCLTKVGLLSLSSPPNSALGYRISSAAPNIETFHVAPRTHPVASMAWNLPSVRPMAHLRKLVASEITVADLAQLVNACGGLRDLEYRNHGFFSEINVVDGPGLLGAFKPARKTLRRLLLVSMTNGNPGGVIRSNAAIESLRGFNQLEELTISHFHVERSLGSRVVTDFAGFLPRSIKHVHLMFIASNVTTDLANLARDAPTKLPNLRSIRISHTNHEDDPSHGPDDWYPALQGPYKHCQELLAAVSITMTWDKLSPKVPRDEGEQRCDAVGKGNYLSMPYGFWESP